MVLDRNLITYVFSPSKTVAGVTVIHLLTNPPTLEPSYHLLRSNHPDHYGIFLAMPADPPGDIVYGEIQVPGGLEVGKGEKAIVLHQPEEVILIGEKNCPLGFRFDWMFEWENKKFKWSRDCIAGIMKSMTLSYIPPKEFKDDPPVTLALFNPSPQLTLLDYNFSRLPINDIKGFEIICILFASLFVDIIHSTGAQNECLAAEEIKKETLRLAKLEEKEEEKIRRQQAELQRQETELLKMLEMEEKEEKRRREEEIERETERLRREEGWYDNDHKPPLPERPSSEQTSQKKKRWWSHLNGGSTSHNANRINYGGWTSRDVQASQDNPPKYNSLFGVGTQ